MQIALALAALCLPGLAWWLWLGNHKLDGEEALARIFAVSMGFISLAALVFYTFRLTFNTYWIGGILSVLLGLVLVGLLQNWKKAFSKSWLYAILALAIFIIWRLWQARALVFPNWTDSQHHVLIIRKIIENGGLPSTLEPYLPGPFYYHFSFHVVTALFSVLSGLSIEASTLLLGQVMNACVGLSIYALAKAIGKDWRIALIAGFLATFVTKMPGYYLSWGRYTLLIGSMIMPVAMAEAETLKRDTLKWWNGLGMLLMVAGTLLSHYLSAFLLAIYFVLYGLEWLIESIKAKKMEWANLLIILLPSLIALLASLRWYIRVLRYSANFISTDIYVPKGQLAINPSQVEYLRNILGPKMAYSLLVMALLGLIWAMFKTDWRKFGIWSFLVALFTVPVGIMIFGFRSDYYGLVLFIVFSILSAALLVWIYDFIVARIKWKSVFTSISLALLLAFLVWGAWSNREAVNKSTILVTKADLSALEWVKSHTPEDSRFFVNTVSWGYGLFRGTDGGGWLLPTTGRWSLAPTTFYPYGLDENEAQLWTDWAKRSSMLSTCDEEFWELVEEANLNYLYIRRGTSGLQPAELQTCDRLRKLYDNDSVQIWLIEPPEEKPEEDQSGGQENPADLIETEEAPKPETTPEYKPTAEPVLPEPTPMPIETEEPIPPTPTLEPYG